MVKDLKSSYDKLTHSLVPRLLTNICRNPYSEFFGCCDRNWWHYKIIDFPSIILQQGGYALSLIDDNKLIEFGVTNIQRDKIVEGVINFWIKRSKLTGYPEEYYPYENGYPPLAFGTLAMAKIISQKKYNFNRNELKQAFIKSSKKLLDRFENRAGNQQVAGLAALFSIKSLFPELIKSNKLDQLVNKTLSLQDEEGWFFEYDGADLGYLSVTLDCLFDIYDCNKDKRILDSIKKCMKFCSTVLSFSSFSLSALNSRNTNYIVPYGFVRGLIDGDSIMKKNCQIVLSSISRKNFFGSIDERYWLHYIGHSLVRASNLLQEKKLDFSFVKNKEDSSLSLPNAGLYELRLNDNNKIIISGYKGGVINYFKNFENIITDFGWTITVGKVRYTSYWFSRDTSIIKSKSKIIINSYMYPTGELVPTPFKHIILRFLSFIFGQKIINLLKNKMIFKKTKKLIKFIRTISKKNDMIRIIDKLEMHDSKKKFLSEPQRENGFSTRHVASADNYDHLNAISNIEISSKTIKGCNGRSYEIITNIK